jgi:heme exporter protein CcmD
MSDFFAMGGYAQYVWPCYGAAFVVLSALLAFSLKELSKQKKELAIMEQMANEVKKS